MRYLQRGVGMLVAALMVVLLPVALLAQTVVDTTVTGTPYTPSSAVLKIVALVVVALVAIVGNKLFEVIQNASAKLDALPPNFKRAILATVTGVLSQLAGLLGATFHVSDITQVSASGWGMMVAMGIGQLFKLLDNQTANNAALVAATAASATPGATSATVTQAAVQAKAAVQG